MTDYVLSDVEWEWVESFLEDRNAPSAYALRGYLNDRITERLVVARADERYKVETEGTDITRWHQRLVLTYLRAKVEALRGIGRGIYIKRADVLDLIDGSSDA
jgi:hypothetical protein